MGLKKYKSLLGNFSYTSLLQLTNIIAPVILLPYLVQTLGVDKFGLISFSQALVAFFLVFIDFGFSLSAVRLIATHSNDKMQLSKIVSSIIIIKIVFIIISFVILCLILLNIDKFQENSLLYLYMFGFVAGEGLLPIWFFQGIQKMKPIMITNSLIKILFFLSVLYFVNTPSDYLNYPILLATSSIMMLPFTYILMIKKYDVSLIYPGAAKITYYLKYSSHFFISRLSVRIYVDGGVLILGLVSTDLIVGYYAMADKFRRAILTLFSSVNQALYPFMSKEKDMGLYKKLFKIITIANILGVSFMLLYTDSLFQLIFGEHSAISLEVGKILIFVIILEVPSILIGYPLLAAYGYTHYVNYSVVATALVFLVIISIIYLWGYITIWTIAYLYAFSIFIELSVRIAGIVKYKLWDNIND